MGCPSTGLSKVTCPSEYQPTAYRLFGSPVPLQPLALSRLALEVFRCEPDPSHVCWTRESLSRALALPQRRPSDAGSSFCHPKVSAFGTSSHEVLRPSSAQDVRVGILSRFHPARLPPRPFSGPRGLGPRSPLQPCFMLLTLMGFYPSGSSPLRWPHRARHPAAPLPAFLLLQSSPAEARLAVQAAPPGVYAQQRVRARGLECCIQSGVDTLLGFVVAGAPSPASPRFQARSGPDSRYPLQKQAPETAGAFRMLRVAVAQALSPSKVSAAPSVGVPRPSLERRAAHRLSWGLSPGVTTWRRPSRGPPKCRLRIAASCAPRPPPVRSLLALERFSRPSSSLQGLPLSPGSTNLPAGDPLSAFPLPSRSCAGRAPRGLCSGRVRGQSHASRCLARYPPGLGHLRGYAARAWPRVSTWHPLLTLPMYRFPIARAPARQRAFSVFPPSRLTSSLSRGGRPPWCSWPPVPSPALAKRWPGVGR